MVKTVALPDGSVVPVVGLKSVHVLHVLRKSDDYYVRIIMRDEGSRDVVEHLSMDAAQATRDELLSLMQQAWSEVEPYEFGYKAGQEAGKSQGYSEGFTVGTSEGYRSGRADGWTEGRNSVISYILSKREELIQKQVEAQFYAPAQRRYIRNAIELLSNVIHHLGSEPSQEGF
jgi:flagellar biosynthesis/type III secretory pathway protein FliH